MTEYYVSGCVDNGIDIETVEDDVAEFWTLYERDAHGLSQGIIDCKFREDAEAAMRVYQERDAYRNAEMVWEKTMMETIGEDGVGSVKGAIEHLKAERDQLQQQVTALAVKDVISERERQQTVEGWTPDHDDKHSWGEMAGAAGCYARHVNARSWIFHRDPEDYQAEECPTNWPWDEQWWKPKSPRQDLVRAAALIIAEIERIDRKQGAIMIEATEVQRDKYGYWTHPDYFEPANGNEYGVSGEFDAWLSKHNLEAYSLSLECDDAAEDIAEKYADGELDCDISSWEPSKPEGDGWFIGSIHDTEDGPYCIWLRQQGGE